MINFEERIGPLAIGDRPLYPKWSFPSWLEDAKFGVFIHWGIYSVPAYAETESAPEIEHAYRDHRYAEWYGNTVRLPDSGARQFHEENFGIGKSYEDLADEFSAGAFNAASVAELVRRSGARYIVPTAKHHDGYCLWDTRTTGFNSVQRGPKRDLIRELANAALENDLRFGVYFSGALDWHVSDFPAIDSDQDVFRYRRNDSGYAQYVFAQASELIHEYKPAILWNDIDWPDAGKGSETFGVSALFTNYLKTVPDGIVNDRWGVPSQGYLTREYSDIGGLSARKWESCRGIGYSFGVNGRETANDLMSVAEIVRHLVSVVTRNGNLLLNIGLAADGSVPDPYAERLLGLGKWLDTNGEAIYGSRAWTGVLTRDQAADYALSAKGSITYVFLTHPTQTTAPSPVDPTGGEWLCDTGPLPVRLRDGVPVVPDQLVGSPVAVFRVRNSAEAAQA